MSGDAPGTVSAKPDWTVLEVKRSLEGLTGAPRCQQKLLIGERVLDDGEVLAAVLPTEPSLELALIRVGRAGIHYIYDYIMTLYM